MSAVPSSNKGKGPSSSKRAKMNLRELDSDLVPNKDDRYSWTDEDELNLLEYLRQTILDNKSIEMPTAKTFWTQYLEKHPFKKCKDKFSWFRRKYLEHKNWRENTEQTADQATVQSKMLKDCRYFEQLDEILCSKSSINPPPGVNTEEAFHVEFFEDQEQDPDQFDQGFQDVQLSKLVSPEQQKSRKVTTRENLFTLMTKREDTKTAEIDFRKDTLDFEKDKWDKQWTFEDRKIKMEEIKTETESKRLDKQLELEQMKVQNNFELEKYKIDKQMELELKIAQLRNSNN